MNPDETPAQGVQVVVDPGQVQGFTANNGMARLTINTEARIDRLTITVSENLSNCFYLFMHYSPVNVVNGGLNLH